MTSQARGQPIQTSDVVGSPISILLISKRFSDGRLQDQIALELQFTSALAKPVRAFTGVVVFQDLFDRDILRVRITVEDAIQPGGAVTWSGGIDYNQFMDDHQRLRSINQGDLQTKFELEMAIYQDGTRVRFENQP